MNILRARGAASGSVKKFILTNLGALFIGIFSQQFASAQIVIKAEIDDPKAYMQSVATLSKKRRLELRLSPRDYRDDSDPVVDDADSDLAAEADLRRIKDPRISAADPDLTTDPQFNRRMNVTGMTGNDPMIAVGERYVLVSDNGQIRFFGKRSGRQVTIENPADKTRVDSLEQSAFFAIYLNPTLPDRHGRMRTNKSYVDDMYNNPNDIPAYCSRDVEDLNNPTDGIINQAYDMRVAYQKDFRRFVILAAIRNSCTRTNPLAVTTAMKQECRGYCVRLVAWAVSHTENPNDGFSYYRTHENNYRDWPRFVVDKDYLTIANDGPGDDGSSMVTVVSFLDMAADKKNPRVFRVSRQDVLDRPGKPPLPRNVIPILTHHAEGRQPLVYFAERVDGNRGLRFWYIRKPLVPQDIFNAPPTMLEFLGLLSLKARRFDEQTSGIVYSNSNFWIVTQSLAHGPRPLKLKSYGLNFFRVPVKRNGTQMSISASGSDGYAHSFHDDENYSYERPAIAVNHSKDVFISFLRYPSAINTSERSQIRYMVFFHDEDGPRPSQLVRESEVPGNKSLDIDYSWAVQDPFESFDFWLVNSFRDANDARSLHVAKVKLSSSN